MRSGVMCAAEKESDDALLLGRRSHLLLIQALMYVMYKLVRVAPYVKPIAMKTNWSLLLSIHLWVYEGMNIK